MSASDRVKSQVEVPAEFSGERVDKVAAMLLDEFSRARLAGWISSGALTVDGNRVKPRQRLKGGETLLLDARFESREDWASAQSIDFHVVHEDDDLLVIDKPAGVVVHPGAGNPDQTLVNGLLAHRPELDRLPRAGIIHRLDKDTSGLLVVAGSLRAHTQLVRALAERRIRRLYLAVAEGRLLSGRDIDSPIGRDRRLRTRQQVREDGRPALTRVRVRERFRIHSLIEAELATGRTHQIRVHLASIGHPLVGDRRYGARGRLPPGAANELIELLQSFPRQALHAWRLELDHPTSNVPLSFESAPPADLRALVEALRRDTDDHVRGDQPGDGRSPDTGR